MEDGLPSGTKEAGAAGRGALKLVSFPRRSRASARGPVSVDSAMVAFPTFVAYSALSLARIAMMPVPTQVVRETVST